jgi:hypothetical protein
MNAKFCGCLLTIAILFSCFANVENRYLPTRSQEDGLDRLRNLLKDVSFSEMEKIRLNVV